MAGRGDELSSRTTHWLRELWLDALALLWPTQCVSCGAPDRDCCDDCRAQLRAGNGTAMWVLTPAGVPACVAGPYAGPLRAQLVAFKHAGRTGFARELGPRLSAPLRVALSLARGPTLPLLVTVPSRAARVRQRGYRHVDMLVRVALTRAGAAPVSSALLSPAPGNIDSPFGPGPHGVHTTRYEPRRAWLVPRALRAGPGRTSQVGLTATERRRNAALIEVSPSAHRILRGREVVLIDDVVTTGATVAAAHRALTESGARVIAIVALCAVERRSARVNPPAGNLQDNSASNSRGKHPNDSNALQCGDDARERPSVDPWSHLLNDAPRRNRVENKW